MACRAEDTGGGQPGRPGHILHLLHRFIRPLQGHLLQPPAVLRVARRFGVDPLSQLATSAGLENADIGKRCAIRFRPTDTDDGLPVAQPDLLFDRGGLEQVGKPRHQSLLGSRTDARDQLVLRHAANHAQRDQHQQSPQRVISGGSEHDHFVSNRQGKEPQCRADQHTQRQDRDQDQRRAQQGILAQPRHGVVINNLGGILQQVEAETKRQQAGQHRQNPRRDLP